MKKHTVAGIMAAALLASGCGDFIRNELITMQNEIDLLYKQVDQMNNGLSNLHGIVDVMASNGYITNVEELQEEPGGYTLYFRTVKLDGNGGVVSEDSFPITLLSGVNGKDGEDAEPFVVSVKQDTLDNRWYWYDAQEDKWLESEDGERFLVDGKDGKTPYLKVEDGYWLLSWDDEDVEDRKWNETGWKAKGEDAQEIFSDAKVFDDRIELTLAEDSTVLTLLRYIPIVVKLTADGKELTDSLKIAPGETVSVSYTVSGTEASKALLVAGTDGRLKTAIKKDSDTTGVVNVTCPDTFPEGGYIYFTLNDGNGRSTVRMVHFIQRAIKVLHGDTEHAAKAAAETGVSVTFETNSELEAKCVFPEGVEPWITATVEAVDNIASLKYDISANTSKDARTGVIVLTPKDNPGFEVARITVTQEGASTQEGA